MEPQIVLFMILATMIPGALSATFTFENKCPYTVWPGILSNSGKPQLSRTGFELASGAPPQTVDSPADWAGRFWGRTRCTTTSGQLKCETADCASGQLGCNGAGGVPPATLAEFTLQGNDNRNQDFYDISLVDGFNLPMGIAQQGGSCPSTTCAADVNSQCLPQLSVKGGDGSTIACKSACAAFNEPRYCCTGDYDGANKCPPTQYSMRFKDACPQAYSYAYNDGSSTFTCTSGANYVITFCP